MRWLKRWRLSRRPRLRPGEVVTFYDSTGLVPRARLVVVEYTVGQDGWQMILAGQERFMKHRRQ